MSLPRFGSTRGDFDQTVWSRLANLSPGSTMLWASPANFHRFRRDFAWMPAELDQIWGEPSQFRSNFDPRTDRVVAVFGRICPARYFDASVTVGSACTPLLARLRACCARERALGDEAGGRCGWAENDPLCVIVGWAYWGSVEHPKGGGRERQLGLSTPASRPPRRPRRPRIARISPVASRSAGCESVASHPWHGF